MVNYEAFHCTEQCDRLGFVPMFCAITWKDKDVQCLIQIRYICLLFCFGFGDVCFCFVSGKLFVFPPGVFEPGVDEQGFKHNNKALGLEGKIQHLKVL